MRRNSGTYRGARSDEPAKWGLGGGAHSASLRGAGGGTYIPSPRPPGPPFPHLRKRRSVERGQGGLIRRPGLVRELLHAPRKVEGHTDEPRVLAVEAPDSWGAWDEPTLARRTDASKLRATSTAAFRGGGLGVWGLGGRPGEKPLPPAPSICPESGGWWSGCRPVSSAAPRWRWICFCGTEGRCRPVERARCCAHLEMSQLQADGSSL
jgi:hypothetical protein